MLRDAVDFPFDPLHHVKVRMVRGHGIFDQAKGVLDAGQGVVDFVGHLSGHAARGGQLLRLGLPPLAFLQGLFRFFALSDVLHRGQKIERLARGGFHHLDNQMNPGNRAVFAKVPLVHLDMVDFALNQLPREFDVFVPIVGMRNIGKAEPGHFLAGIAGYPADASLTAHVSIIQGDDRRADGQLVEREAEPLFVFLQGILRSLSLGDVDALGLAFEKSDLSFR